MYGDDAIIQSGSNPTNSFSFFLPLIGMEYNDKNLEFLRKVPIFNNIVKDDRGYVAFKVDFENGEETESKVFTIEEIIAVVLSHAKFLAEKQAKSSVPNAYLTVPHSFTMNQRRMLSDAAEIAGLKCIGMVEENSAAALTYGIDRKDENETHSVLFLNLGSSNFETTVAKYFARKENVTDSKGNVREGDLVENIEILSHESTDKVSGRLFDLEVLNILTDFFNSLKARVGKPDIRENPRIVNRLLKEVPKIKEVLSANKEKIVVIPEVADYENLKMTVSREDFEKAIEKYLGYLKETIYAALKKANLSVSELSGVEIIGGALRVPKVKEILQEVVGELALGTHINGDEAMSFGAAFLGANLSSSFIARKIFFHHLTEEPIKLRITSVNLNSEDPKYIKKEYNFFEKGDSLNEKRKYSIETTDDLKAEFYTETKGVIHQVYLTGVPAILESEEYNSNSTVPKVSFYAYLSYSGFIVAEKVSAKYSQTYMKEVERRILIQNETVTEEAEKVAETQTPEDIKPSESGANSTSNSTVSSKNATSEPKYEYVKELVEKNRTISKDVNMTEAFIGHQPLSSDDKVKAIAHLADLAKRDKLILDTFKAKNDFEALIYSSRDWINNEENQVYTTPETIEQFLQNLTNAEDWLYEEGFDESLKVYQKKIKEVNNTINPIKFRKEEHSSRDTIVSGSLDLLNNFASTQAEFMKRVPWVNETKLEKIREMVDNTTVWLQDLKTEQDKMELWQDPVLLTDDIRDRIYVIGNTMDRLGRVLKFT